MNAPAEPRGASSQRSPPPPDKTRGRTGRAQALPPPRTRTVGAAPDGYPGGVRDAQADHLVHRRLGPGDELLDIRVVGLLGADGDDRERGPVEDGVPLGEPHERAHGGDAAELEGALAHLPGGLAALELARVRPQDARQAAVALRVVPRRREERRCQVHAVVALVAEDALRRVAQLRVRVREVGELDLRGGVLGALGAPREGVVLRLLLGALVVGREADGGRVGGGLASAGLAGLS